ncbi:MAG TPA: outer membrane protein assembly factor BamE [Steroidobacteraceae bacterium]
MRMSRDGHGAQALQRIGARTNAAVRALAWLGALCALSACVYRMPIQQGNYLDPAIVAQIKPGMTHSQVRYLLGTPMVPGAFDNARWDYDYYIKTRRLHGPNRGHVTIYFSDNLVARVESDVKKAPDTTFNAKGALAPEPRSAGGH